jgi:hypothetical protein
MWLLLPGFLRSMAADPALWNVVEFVVSTPAGLEEECDERGV